MATVCDVHVKIGFATPAAGVRSGKPSQKGRGDKMPSERRDAPRIPYALDAVITGGGCRALPCRTRDISVNGVFVQFRGAQPNPTGPIELMVKMPSATARPMRRFHAQIVHTSAEGAGLLFDQTNADGYVPLIKLVFAKPRLPELL